jgi:PAS domain S-box-containing protein
MLFQDAIQKTQRIYKDLPVGLCYLDTDLRFIYINDWLAEINGIPAEEHFGRTLGELIPDVAAGVEAQYRQVIDTGEPIIGGTVEAETPDQPGIKRHFRHSYFPIRSDDGAVIGISCIVEDVTVRNEAVAALRQANDELEQRVQERTAELRAAQDTLLRNERLSTLGQLTATVSHELRNPLGVILASIPLLRDGLEKEAPRAWRSLDRVERSVIRCDRIIEEMTDYTRIRDLEPEFTRIETWISKVLDEQTIPSGIQLRQEFHLPGVMVPFDPDRLRRAVINVFDNACQAMTGEVDAGTVETEHTLTVRTNQANGRIEMIFEDTGPGIPPELSTKIFEPMFSTKSFGVGLGLPVVNQIMEQHDGGIEIESEDGRGTKVCLWLPGSQSVQENP